MQTLDFLRLLWPAGSPNGFVTLWTPAGNRSLHLPVGAHEAVAAAAMSLDASGAQVYVGCGILAAPPASGRGTRAGICALPGFWLDIDFASPVHASAALPPGLEDACAMLDAGPAQPSVIVHSGYGLHAWWLFDRPLAIDDSNRAHAQKVAKAFQALWTAEAAKRGWHLDPVSDLARILRLPGTHNRKIPDDPKPVEMLLGDDAARGSFSGFEAMCMRKPGRPRKAQPSAAVAEIPEPKPVDIGALRERLKRLAPRPGLAELLDGRSIAPSLERDDRLQRICSAVAWTEPDGDPEQLAELFEPTIAIWAAELGARLSLEEERAKVIDKLSRAREEYFRRQAERGFDEEPFREALRRGMADADGAARGDPFDPSDGLDPGTYSDEDMARYAAAQGTTSDGFGRRWIIQSNDTYWIFKDGRYLSPVSGKMLPIALPRDLARADVRWTKTNADGKTRRRLPADMVVAYGSAARKVVADLALQESIFDADAEIFFEAPCPLRKLEPREDPRIDRWLRFLGGVEQAKLLDWVATVARLDRQTCALYLSGPPSVGKGMLTAGLARLWTLGGPSELSRVIEGFNEDLVRCPLVIADEQLPKAWKGNMSAELRGFIGSGARTLARKYVANATLVGAVRLILCANNDRMLLGDEDLGPYDLEAIAGRYLHIEAGAEAAEYLASIGGRAGTEGWIEDDLIARHALWLADERDVTPGDRWLVEGRLSSMHRTLAVQGRVPSLVCEWLAKHLVAVHERSALAFRGDTVIVGDGEYLINVAAISEAWAPYIKSDFVPTTHRIGKALANLSSGMKRVDGPRFHKIKWDLVIEWADRCQIGDPDSMRATVLAPRVAVAAMAH